MAVLATGECDTWPVGGEHRYALFMWPSRLQRHTDWLSATHEIEWGRAPCVGGGEKTRRTDGRPEGT